MESGMFRYYAGKIKLLTAVFLVSLILTGSGGEVRELSFDEFREYLKTEGVAEFEAVFDGIESPAPVSGNKYLFLQIVTYCGEGDVMSSYRTWNSDDEFTLVYENFRVKLDRSRVRTFIEKTGSFKEKDIDDGRMLPSDEYGLVKNRKYYAKISSEEYHLPPDRESGKPRRRTNHVIWISSRPFKDGKPQVELTPMYKGWSY
jgi:hypothetical protein